MGSDGVRSQSDAAHSVCRPFNLREKFVRSFRCLQSDEGNGGNSQKDPWSQRQTRVSLLAVFNRWSNWTWSPDQSRHLVQVTDPTLTSVFLFRSNTDRVVKVWLGRSVGRSLLSDWDGRSSNVELFVWTNIQLGIVCMNCTEFYFVNKNVVIFDANSSDSWSTATSLTWAETTRWRQREITHSNCCRHSREEETKWKHLYKHEVLFNGVK